MKAALFISIGLFIVSLTQPCFCTTNSCGASIAALLSGTIGFLFGGAALTWLANPLLFISWNVINRNPRLSLLTSIAAFLIALSFLLFDGIITDEAGNYYQIISYQSGYWLWVSSSLVMAVGNTIRYFKRQQNSVIDKEE